MCQEVYGIVLTERLVEVTEMSREGLVNKKGCVDQILEIKIRQRSIYVKIKHYMQPS